MFLLLLVILLLLLMFYIYNLGCANENYFKDRGIKYIKPTFIFGNSANIFLRRISVFDDIQEKYKAFPEEKLIGVYELRSPCFMIRDPDLLKQLAIKDFESFTDRRSIFNTDADEYFGNSLVALQGQKWKDMRATLSPAFTGSKMRLMFQLVSDCCDQMVNYVKEDKKGKTYEMKDFLSRMTNDIIATCAFGISVDSLRNPENEFYVLGKEMLLFTKPLILFKFFGYKLFPGLMRFLNVKIMDQKIISFFRNTLHDAFRLRETKKMVRPDLINLLIEARRDAVTHQATEHHSTGSSTVEESNIGKGTCIRSWSDVEIYAQCLLFFVAGFDTSATAMAFCAYELAINPDIQKRLFQEIKTVNRNLNNEKLNYDSLQKMIYLDMVVSETLRKWPPGPMTDRACVKDYKYVDEKGFCVQIKKGQHFNVPITGFHYDPKYFREPETFDPERFSDDNKKNLNLAAYLPFGIGPRNCIGSRFALMEIKAVIYYLLLNFSLEISEKTHVPLKISKKMAGMTAENGIWVDLTPRKK